MDIFKAFATDETKEVEGAWFDVPGGDARVRVARSTNPKYARAVVDAYENLQKSKLPKAELEKKQEAAYTSLMATHLLVGWEGVQFKGKTLPYSQANAEMLLQIRDFRIFVVKCSEDFDAFRVEVEEEVGNV